MKRKNRIGKRFGSLIVTDFGRVIKKLYPKYTAYKVHWICKCDCGNSVERSSEYLQMTDRPSCGQCLESHLLKDRSGERHGLLTIVSFSHVEKILQPKKLYYLAWWNCVCDCGKLAKRSVRNFNLKTKLHCGNITCKRRITSCSHSTISRQNSEQSTNFSRNQKMALSLSDNQN